MFSLNFTPLSDWEDSRWYGASLDASSHFSPFEVVGQTHAEAFGSRLHASANHQPVAGLEDVQRAGHGGEGHGAHKYRHFLVETVETQHIDKKDRLSI